MSPGKQLLMDGFPAPPDYMSQVDRLHTGARYTITFYQEDLLVDSNEVAQIEHMRFDDYRAFNSELTLLLSEVKTEDYDDSTT